MKRAFAAVATAVLLVLVAHQPVRAQGSGGLDVEITGVAGGAFIEISMNGGKIADLQSDAQGTGTTVLDLSNQGKALVQVYIDVCKDGKVVRVHLVTNGQEPPKDENCDRKLAGVFWAHKAKRLTIDVGAGTIQVSNALPLTTIGLGAAAGGALVAALAAGGGSDPGSPQTPNTPSTPTTPNTPVLDPTGNFPTMIAFKGGNIEHLVFVALGGNGTLNVTRNSPIRIASTNIQNWVTVSGDINDTTGQFNLTGVGTVAGVPNVSVRFEGTITMSGQLTGDYTMGAGGELPGGQPIIYAVTGQKQ
jgi:hypothetical protein